MRTLDAEPRGGHGGECGQRLVGREPTRHGGAQVGKELRERRESVGGDGEGHAGGGQLRRVGGSEVPVPQVGQRHVERRLGARHGGRVGKVQRQHERLCAALQHIDEPVLLTAATEPRCELVLLREFVGAQVLLFACGLEEYGLLALHRFAEGRERLARFRRQRGAAAGFVGAPRAAVPLGVHQRLLHERDGAHGGVRVHATERERALEADRLRQVGAQHALAHAGVAEAHDRSGAAKDALSRNGEGGPETKRAKRRAAGGIVLQVGGGAEPRPNLWIPVRGAHIAAYRGCVTTQVGVGVDKAGIHRETLEVPHAGTGRRAKSGTDGRNQSVANDDRGVVQNLTRGGDHSRADQGVEARAVVAQASDRLCTRGLLGLERSGGERRQAEEETKRSHEGLWIREGDV